VFQEYNLTRLRNADLRCRLDIQPNGAALITRLAAGVLNALGATRAIAPFKLSDWPGLLCAVANDGPNRLIRQVRIVEDADPSGIQYPRNKIHDDATVAVLDL
jgi:hypothetical protein